jgi:tungstate transport system permease protein
MEESIFQALYISLYVSCTATIIGFLFSFPIAVIIITKKFHLKKLLITTINALTAIPPVCAGLICYLIVSRTGPFGWMGILYTPQAMMIAQFIIIVPIMMSLIINNLQEEYPLFEEELRSYGAKLGNIIKLLLLNKYKIYITIGMIGFGRAISEYGAASIVGGSIDQLTKNMTATIAQETSKGNIYLALKLGIILLAVSFTISFISQIKK